MAGCQGRSGWQNTATMMGALRRLPLQPLLLQILAQLPLLTAVTERWWFVAVAEY